MARDVVAKDLVKAKHPPLWQPDMTPQVTYKEAPASLACHSISEDVAELRSFGVTDLVCVVVDVGVIRVS